MADRCCRCCSSLEIKKFGSFRNKNRVVQRFQCRRCGTTFSESQPLNETRIDAAKGGQIVHQLCEGVGIRSCARLCGVHKQTVLHILESAGRHCRDFLEYRMRGLSPTHVEIDEIWTFVQKKQYHAKNHPIFGDQYCWLSIDQPTKLILNWQVAKRSKEAAYRFVGDLRERTTGHIFDLSTDGFDASWDGPGISEGAVRYHFGGAVNYGTEIQKYGTLLQGQDAERKYSPLVCTSCRRSVKIGTRDQRGVTVNHAERQNLNVRLFTRRFTRLTRGFSKKLANLEHAVALLMAFHNFCRPHTALYQKATETTPARQITPAMAAGLTDHVWTIAELLAVKF